VFVVLLATAVIWPRPVLWINAMTFRAELSISTVSFLGREAPSWDVAYWAVVGFAVLGLFHGRLGEAAATWRVVGRELSGVRPRARRLWKSLKASRVLALALALTGFCCVVWLVIDAPLMAQVSRIGSERVHDYVRLSNRLGGGGNPPMVIGFFVLAGLALQKPRWAQLGIAMAVSAASAGLVASLLKPLVARTRPDLWLGPFSRVWGGESSFPSGHTISAFAIAGAAFASSRSWPFRVVFLLAATSIATTRVIALRHWPSDVVVSAILGTLLGLAAGKVFAARDDGIGDEPGNGN
jgi:undecaprenyl-diphosphatase